MRTLNEEQEDHSLRNRGECRVPPLSSAPGGPGQSFLADLPPLSTGGGLGEARALVCGEQPHSVATGNLVTLNEDKGTPPRAEPCHWTPPLGKSRNVGMMRPTPFLLERLR